MDDLYLDLVVYPDGTIKVDDMDELEEALSKKDITQEQFNLAVETSHRLQRGMLSNISSFMEYTKRCCEMISYSSHYFSNYNWKKVVKLPVNTML